jgi:hypothetical protein
MTHAPRTAIASPLVAYLGHLPARELLGAKSPQKFSMQSMVRGGDRAWRDAMQVVGHEAVAVAACAVAELGIDAYLTAPDAPAEVEALARDAVAALRSWRSEPRSQDRLAEVSENGKRFCLAVKVGGRPHNVSGWRAQNLGGVVGLCYSVVLAPENRRYVRWLGEAAEATCRLLGVSQTTIVDAVASALLPYAIASEPFSDFGRYPSDPPADIPPTPSCHSRNAGAVQAVDSEGLADAGNRPCANFYQP